MVDKNKRPKILCVLRDGGEYTIDHVRRLEHQLFGNVTRDVQFVCLTDIDWLGKDPFWDVVPITEHYPGWWSKLELFKIRGPCLYFDLDTSIHGNIDAMVDIAYEREFVALRDVNPRVGILGSGVMAWNGNLKRIFNKFAGNPKSYMRQCIKHGDQKFLENCWRIHINNKTFSFWQDLLPGVLVSHKRHCQQGLPPGAVVEFFHGKPRPWDVAATWRMEKGEPT